MSLLKSLHKENIIFDIRYALFKKYIVIIGFLSLILTLINAINKRPPANIYMGLVSLSLCAVCFYTSKKQERYLFSRMLFYCFFTFIFVPLGYITSPGSYSAMLYLIILTVFMLSIVAVNKWEYVFPIIIILLVPILLRTEIWFSDWYYKYTDEVYRINDITLNYSVVIVAIVLTMIYMMHHYKIYNDSLYKISITDSLTGLYNRRYFFDFTEMEYNRSKRNNTPFSIVFIDLNHFKRINDTYGHLTGDDVLKDIAKIIMENVRSYDIAGRYGGDEFIIILPNTKYEEALSLISRMRKNLKALTDAYKDLGFSVGFGCANSQDKSLDEVISLADQRLYEDKDSLKGNNMVNTN